MASNHPTLTFCPGVLQYLRTIYQCFSSSFQFNINGPICLSKHGMPICLGMQDIERVASFPLNPAGQYFTAIVDHEIIITHGHATV